MESRRLRSQSLEPAVDRTGLRVIGQTVVGDIPAERPGLQPRPGLLAALNQAGLNPAGLNPAGLNPAGLNRAGAGGPVVQVLTGRSGVGRTQLAAAYARAKAAAAWRLVAWVNAGSAGSLLAGLA